MLGIARKSFLEIHSSSSSKKNKSEPQLNNEWKKKCIEEEKKKNWVEVDDDGKLENKSGSAIERKREKSQTP